MCKAAGVDPFASDCMAQAAGAPAEFADCCLGTTNDPFLSPTIQERAWGSPVWYRPEAIGRLQGRLTFGKQPSDDALALHATLGGLPEGLDLAAAGLTVRLSDDDDGLAIAVPPGGFRKRGRRLFYKDRTDGRRKVTVTTDRKGVKITVAAQGGDLSRIAREDHFVTFGLEAPLYRTSYTRRWLLRGRRLRPVG